MSKVHAYALHTIHRRDADNKPVVVPASKTGSISVFETIDETEFEKLEKLGAVRRATRDEIAVAKANADHANGTAAIGDASGETVVEGQEDPNKIAPKPEGEGGAATKDPAGKPSGKGAKKKDDDI